MIRLEEKEGKYNVAKHASRLRLIADEWKAILAIIREELPAVEYLDKLYEKLGLPKSPTEIGTDKELLPVIFCASKDIRDKYVLSRLLFDLGVLDEFAQTIE